MAYRLLPILSCDRFLNSNEKIVLAYPGTRAKFVHCLDRYGQIEFRSKTNGSMITKFIIFGDTKIAVYFGDNIDTVMVSDYLADYDIVPDNIDFHVAFYTSERTQLRNMLNIICKNNELPKSHFERICAIINKL